MQYACIPCDPCTAEESSRTSVLEWDQRRRAADTPHPLGRHDWTGRSRALGGVVHDSSVSCTESLHVQLYNVVANSRLWNYSVHRSCSTGYNQGS